MYVCIYIGMVECSCKAHKAADGARVESRGQIPPDDICIQLVGEVVIRGRQRARMWVTQGFEIQVFPGCLFLIFVVPEY